MGADRLLVWGLAGAITDDLEPGCLVVPEVVLGPTGLRYEMAPFWQRAWSHRLWELPATRVVTGALATLRSAAGPAERRSLRLPGQPVAVDMETAAVADVARHQGLECLAVRAIIDTPAAPWPTALSGIGRGRAWPWQVTAVAAARFWEWPRWLEMAAAFATARRALETAAVALSATPLEPAAQRDRSPAGS
jgi:hypothetical protein